MIFEEHWTNAPLTQPMKQENLGNQHPRLNLYGGVAGIRKTQHPAEDYTYTGETRNTWMIRVSDPTNYFDLRLPAKMTLRTRKTGYRQTHIAIADMRSGRYAAIFAGNAVTLSEASDELLRLAVLLDIPVATTLMAKGVFPEDHRRSLGMTGIWGARAANDTTREADVVLAIGTGFAEADCSSWDPNHTLPSLPRG